MSGVLLEVEGLVKHFVAERSLFGRARASLRAAVKPP